MKKKFITALISLIVIGVSMQSFAFFAAKGSNYSILFAKAQDIIENLSDINDISKLSETEKAYFADMFIIHLKSADVVYSPENQTLSKSDAINLADKLVKLWQADESKVFYDLGNYLASVVVTNSRDVYIMLIPYIYQVKKRYNKSFFRQ